MSTSTAHTPEASLLYDIFLSHNSKDKALIEDLAVWLRDQGIRVWFDKWHLVPGRPWQEGLEAGIEQSRSMAVCVGPSGFGQWEIPEMRAALNLYVQRKSPVIPILLPGCPSKPELPMFLQAYMWIDFRKGLDDQDAQTNLLWAITGKNPHDQAAGSAAPAPRQPSPASTALRTRIMEGKNRRLKRKLEGIERQEDLLQEKLHYLQEHYSVAPEGAQKFQMKKQIEQLERDLAQLDEQIDELYQQVPED